VVAALCGQRVLAPLCYEHTTTGEFFEGWFGEELLRCVPVGCTVVMDNASVHRKKKLYALVAGTGVSLLFLSPYSPDFNPIEKKWTNLKKTLPTQRQSLTHSKEPYTTTLNIQTLKLICYNTVI
jgi:transposase